MNKVAIGAVVAVTAIGLGMMPASAGLPPGGRVIVAPDEVEVCGSVVVSNEPEWESTCVPAVLPSAASSGSVVDIEIEDPNGDLIVDEKVIPDGEGNWSYEVTGLTLIGEYTVITWCEYPPSIVAEGF